jgi:hypothetical protein
LARVINPDSVGKRRTQLVRATALALRELVRSSRQSEPDNETRDLVAFISLSIQAISETIDPSVEAWEKRGYWVKADHFRMEWAWTTKLSRVMREALFAEDWATVMLTGVQISQKLGNIKISEHHRMGTPWLGAWAKLQNHPHQA